MICDADIGAKQTESEFDEQQHGWLSKLRETVEQRYSMAWIFKLILSGGGVKKEIKTESAAQQFRLSLGSIVKVRARSTIKSGERGGGEARRERWAKKKRHRVTWRGKTMARTKGTKSTLQYGAAKLSSGPTRTNYVFDVRECRNKARRSREENKKKTVNVLKFIRKPSTNWNE